MIVTDEHLNKLIPEISFFITKHINDGGDYQNFNIEDILVANQENIIKKLDYKNQHIFILYLLSCGISPNISYGNEYSILENLVMSSAYSNNNIYIIINIIENHDGQIMKLTPYVSNNHDADGVSLLMIAIDSKAFHVAKYLIDKGIDSNIRDSNGKTALDYFNMINENDVPDDFQDDYMYVKNKLQEGIHTGGNMFNIPFKVPGIDGINNIKNNIIFLKKGINNIKDLLQNPENINEIVNLIKTDSKNAHNIVNKEDQKQILNIIGNIVSNNQYKNTMLELIEYMKNIQSLSESLLLKPILLMNPEINIPLQKVKEKVEEKVKENPKLFDNIEYLIRNYNIENQTVGGKYNKKRRKKKKKRKKTKRKKYKNKK